MPYGPLLAAHLNLRKPAFAGVAEVCSTTVGENTADISELFTSVNGLGVQWAIQAYVGGSYGGVYLNDFSTQLLGYKSGGRSLS